MLTAPATTLMNQLSCSKKMCLISIAFISPLLITLYFLTNELLNEIQSTQKEHQGVEYIIPLQQLIQHIPEHRGLTHSFLSGNQTIKAKILQERQEIVNDIILIDQIDQVLGEQLNTTNQWNKIKSRWRQLESKAFNGQATAIFNEHTRLMSQILDLLKQISDQSNLTLAPELDSFTSPRLSLI